MADTARPPLKGKTVTLVGKKAATLGGLSISFTSMRHTHADGGDAVGMWSFVVKKGAKSKKLELRFSNASSQAEVVIHGVALAFEPVEREKFAVTLIAQEAPKPLDDHACAEKVSALAAKQGVKEGTWRRSWNHDGIVVVTTANWRGYCGTLTERVWIETENADEAKPDKIKKK